MQKHGVPVWMYSFNTTPGFISASNPCLRAGHSTELSFLFPHMLETLNYTFNQQELWLRYEVPLLAVGMCSRGCSNWMIEAWTQFVTFNTVPTIWESYTANLSQFIVLEANQKPGPTGNVTMKQHFRQTQCNFWDRNGSEVGSDRTKAGLIVLGIVSGAALVCVGAIVVFHCRRRPKEFESV